MYAIVLAALVVADVNVEPKAVTKSQPPDVITAQIKGDRLVSQQMMQTSVMVPKRIKVLVNGKQQERIVLETVMMTRPVEFAWNLKKATIATAGGKKLSLDDLKKRLGKSGLVVLSHDGKAIDSGYLKILAPDTVVIVAPKIPFRQPGKVAPQPAPVPVPLPAPKPRPIK